MGGLICEQCEQKKRQIRGSRSPSPRNHALFRWYVDGELLSGMISSFSDASLNPQILQIIKAVATTSWRTSDSNCQIIDVRLCACVMVLRLLRHASECGLHATEQKRGGSRARKRPVLGSLCPSSEFPEFLAVKPDEIAPLSVGMRDLP